MEKWLPEFELGEIVYHIIDPRQEEMVVVEIVQFGDYKRPVYKYLCSHHDFEEDRWFYGYTINNERDDVKFLDLPWKEN